MTDGEKKALERRYEESRRLAEEKGVFVRAKARYQELRKKYNR